MKENVLDVLIYLFENYMFDDVEPDQETLAWELSQAGFEQSMIDGAFNWLENLALLCEDRADGGPAVGPGAIRHFSDGENAQLDLESKGFLLSLEQCGVLDPVTREMVIDQLMALGVETIELEQVKWVVLMVLSNYTNGEGVTELTETLVLDGLNACMH